MRLTAQTRGVLTQALKTQKLSNNFFKLWKLGQNFENHVKTLETRSRQTKQGRKSCSMQLILHLIHKKCRISPSRERMPLLQNMQGSTYSTNCALEQPASPATFTVPLPLHHVQTGNRSPANIYWTSHMIQSFLNRFFTQMVITNK